MESRIGKAHFKQAHIEKKTTFNREYNKLLRLAGIGTGGQNSQVMRKSVPSYIAKLLAGASSSKNEWGGGMDFELLEQQPERVLMNRGRTDQVLRDDPDFELNFHTHPPHKGERGFTLDVFPSGADCAITRFGKPELIAVQDNDGRMRFILVRALKHVKQYHFKKQIDDILHTLLSKYQYPFPTREERKKFGVEYRKALNDLGYDFTYIKLDQHVIEMDRDDKTERVVRLPRKSRIERKLLASFKQSGFDPSINTWFNYGYMYVSWEGPRDLDASKLQQWCNEHGMRIIKHEQGQIPGNKFPSHELTIAYERGIPTANEPGGPSWETSGKPKGKKRGKKELEEKIDSLEATVKEHAEKVLNDLEKGNRLVIKHHHDEIKERVGLKKGYIEQLAEEYNSYKKAMNDIHSSNMIVNTVRDAEQLLEDIEQQIDEEWNQANAASKSENLASIKRNMLHIIELSDATRMKLRQYSSLKSRIIAFIEAKTRSMRSRHHRSKIY